MNIAQRIQRPVTRLLFAGVLASTSLAAMAQQGYPQPYNSQDPNNYGAPAAQSYNQQYPQGQGYPDQQQYADQDQAQPEDAYGPPQDAIQQAPPPLPDYDQPPDPEDGNLWTPGYWAYGPGGYYWVNGAWVAPPYVGALWTPGYWGYGPYGYFWNAGYWGNSVGYYGGINYGFGYFGTGFYGGYWNSGRFFYNRAYGHFGFRGGSFYNQPYAGGYGHIRAAGASFTAVNHGYAPGFHGERGGTFNRQGADFRGQHYDGNRGFDGSRNDGNRGFVGGRNDGNRSFDGTRNDGYRNPGNTGVQTGGYNRTQPQQPLTSAPSNVRSGQPAQGFGQGTTNYHAEPATGLDRGNRQPFNGQGGTNYQAAPAQGSYNRGYGNPQYQMQRPSQSAPTQAAPNPGYYGGRSMGSFNAAQARPQQQAAPSAPRSAPPQAGGGGARFSAPAGGGGGFHGGGHR